MPWDSPVLCASGKLAHSAGRRLRNRRKLGGQTLASRLAARSSS